MTRIEVEVDHLTTREAFNVLGSDTVGLGYNGGGLAYCWEMTKAQDGGVKVVVNGRLEVEAPLAEVARYASLPVCGFVSQLVSRVTGNDALHALWD